MSFIIIKILILRGAIYYYCYYYFSKNPFFNVYEIASWYPGLSKLNVTKAIFE